MECNLLTILANFRKRLARVYPLMALYLSLLLTMRKLIYCLRTWPKPIGRSPMERLVSRELRVMRFLSLTKRRLVTPIIFVGSAIEDAVETDLERLRNHVVRSSEFQPICFSWPKSDFAYSVFTHRSQEISTVIPWHPYSFNSYSTYLEQYARSKYAMTFKKGGWDCFRHIEIMAANAVPFMPDISRCPELTMHYYPKALMTKTLDYITQGDDIFAEIQSYQSEWFSQYLTSHQMVKKILETLDKVPNKIFFADPGLNSQPDYLSVQIYCGLKSLLGSEGVTTLNGAASVFEDWNGDSSALHGLGFGYTRLLPVSLRNSAETNNSSSFEDLIKSAGTNDLVIIGDTSRNVELAQRFSSDQDLRATKIFLWGADRAPDRSERKWLARLNGIKFVREIY